TILYTLSLHDALPIYLCRETEVERMVLPRADHGVRPLRLSRVGRLPIRNNPAPMLDRDNLHVHADILRGASPHVLYAHGDPGTRSEEHTSELQSRSDL